MQEQSSSVQVKDPYSVSILMHVLQTLEEVESAKYLEITVCDSLHA